MRIGFIGLGVIGLPVAQHLIKGGHEITSTLQKILTPQTLIK
jgi:3-hydroxyisobutyrate dehydrogenase-like beta-hydroxyacid dehydrogenase